MMFHIGEIGILFGIRAKLTWLLWSDCLAAGNFKGNSNG